MRRVLGLRLPGQMAKGLQLVSLLCVCSAAASGGHELPACASAGGASWKPYRYLAHAWEATCWIPGTLPIYSDAIAALTAAGSSGGCAAFEGIVGMIDSGGSPFSPGGFGDLANESVPCLVRGNRHNPACPQHCDGCDNGAFTDTKGGFPLGLLGMPNGSRVVHIQGPQRDAIMHCYDRGARPGSPKNLSRCAGRIAVPECGGQIPATAFAGWEFTLWPDAAMTELREQAEKYFAAVVATGAVIDEIVQDTELIESHYARIVAPNFEAWYPGNAKMVNSKSYPTVSDACARARWLAIQRDQRWPALLTELTARGFRANTSAPEYLAKAMGLYITAPCVGDGNAYSMSDSLNQAIFNAVMSEHWGAAWSSTYLEAGRKHWPELRSSNYDFRKRDPRFCIPERADGVPDCAVAGGGVVGMQAPNAYPNEYNASLITPALVKYFGYPSSKRYELSGFNMMRWIGLHKRANILAAPSVPLKPWLFPKSVCYAGHECPLVAKNGATYWEELLFHLALAGSRGFYLFNPFFDYVSVIEGPRVKKEDYVVMANVLRELNDVIGCEGVWVRDGSLRFEDGFFLSGMAFEATAGKETTRIWRLTLDRPLPASSVVSGRGDVVNVTGVSAKLSGGLAQCNLLFAGGARILNVNGTASTLGLWISQPGSARCWLQCGAKRMQWPPPDHAAPPLPPRSTRFTCRGGLCVEYAGGNFSDSECSKTCAGASASMSAGWLGSGGHTKTDDANGHVHAHRPTIRRSSSARPLLTPNVFNATNFGASSLATTLDLASATYAFDTEVSARARAAVSGILPSAWATAVATQAELPCIALRLNHFLPRGDFRLRADALAAGGARVELWAGSDRGFILGAGRLRRELRIHSSGEGAVHLPLPFEIEISQPKAAQHQQIRGTEFTTAFVGPGQTQPGGFSSWDNVERYVKELAIFGGNEVELAHPEIGDVLNAMVGNWSRLCDRWDVGLSIWLPVDNAATPFTPADAQQYSELFGNCTRLDAIHIPGGDGGPGYFSEPWWGALKQVATMLRRHHPKAEVTVSSNGFNSTSFERFFEALEDPETQTWLDGLQLGKEEPLPLAQFVNRLSQVHMSPPRKPYYILRVPDITHTVETGFPVPAWDYTWSSTHGREAINLAPHRFAAIIELRANGSTPTIGYSAYSEGLNGDFNKCLFSALTMEPGLSAENLTRQYARTFFGAENEEAAAAGLMGLEQNWIGRAEANPAPATTLRLWDQVQPNGSNWRLDMHRFRATVDAYVQARQRHELGAEAAAQGTLRHSVVGATGVDSLIAAARASLSNGSGFGEKTEDGRALKAQVWRLFDALNDSVSLCLGCASGGGISTISSQSKGTLNLQNIDSPLSNAPWLLRQLALVSSLPSEAAKRQAVRSLLSPTWPIELPPGSFYDWVGSISSSDRPHLLMGEGVPSDPMHYFTPLLGGSGCTGRHYAPGSAQTDACLASVPLKRMSKVGVSKGQKLQMRWKSLDVHARYTLHVAFPGPLTHDAYGSETDHGHDNSIRLWAGGSLLYSGLPTNVTILALPVPRNETAGGALSFSCDSVGSPEAESMFQFLFGVDCKLSEVWLVRGGSVAPKVK